MAEQSGVEGAAQAQQPPQDDAPKWGDPLDRLSQERKDELAKRLWEWKPEMATTERPGPFARKPTESYTDDYLSGLDVFWLAVCAVAGHDGDIGEAEQALRSLDVPFLSLEKLHLERAYVFQAHLEKAYLSQAHLEGAAFFKVHLEGAHLSKVHLEGAGLASAQLQGAFLSNAHLEGAHLAGAHLEGVDLSEAHLEGADLRLAHLEGAFLYETHLEGRRLRSDELAHLRMIIPTCPDPLLPADLRGAFFDMRTRLKGVNLGNGEFGLVSLADVNWSGANLAVVKWFNVPGQPRKRLKAVMLGDEREARARKYVPLDAIEAEEELKDAAQRLDDFEAAARANRQLATALRDQGLNDDADRFAYQAQVLQRKVLRRQGRYGAWIGSFLLDRIAGYGYRPGRSFFTYLAVLLVFAGLYLLAGNGLLTFGLPPSQYHTLPWYEALILSVSSFHGRGFFQPLNSPGDPVAILASVEAVFGLFIEVSFIATFTQRFFGK